MKNRIVILCGPDLRHLNTCRTLIDSDLNVVGICICDENSFGFPLKYIFKKIKKKGFFTVFFQILGRLFYNLFNSNKDRIVHEKLYNELEIKGSINNWNKKIIKTINFDNSSTIKSLEQLKSDIFVVHSGSWITKKVREIPTKKIVIGGHPGLIPNYRGSHSSFWAIYNNKPNDVGCSVFLLNNKLDAGDLIAKRRIKIEKDDSYITLGWKGMIEEAKIQRNYLLDLDRGLNPKIYAIKEIPKNSHYDLPTIFDYIKYRISQNKVR